MAKMSIRVRNRTENAAYVISSTTTHGAQVAAALVALDEALPEERRLGADVLEALLAWTGHVLEHANLALTEAEHAYVLEQGDAPTLREERDARAAALVRCVSQVRVRVGQLFARSTLSSYGLVRQPPRRAKPILGYARAAIALMRKSPRRAEDEVGSLFDTDRAADAMERRADELAEVMARLTVDKRARDAAMVERDGRMGAWERAFRGAGNMLAGLYQLAGEDELCRRIRPSERRALGIEVVTAEPEEPSAQDEATPAHDDDAAPEVDIGPALEAAAS